MLGYLCSFVVHRLQFRFDTGAASKEDLFFEELTRFDLMLNGVGSMPDIANSKKPSKERRQVSRTNFPHDIISRRSFACPLSSLSSGAPCASVIALVVCFVALFRIMLSSSSFDMMTLFMRRCESDQGVRCGGRSNPTFKSGKYTNSSKKFSQKLLNIIFIKGKISLDPKPRHHHKIQKRPKIARLIRMHTRLSSSELCWRPLGHCAASRERERILRPTQLQSQTFASPLEYLVTIIREHIKQAPSNERKTELPKHQ